MRQEQLPIESDFYTRIGDLDGQHVWKCFGGLTLEQTREKFLEHSEFYQEDFKFIRGKAIAYYFPVIEEYLKSAIDGAHRHDHSAWIPSHGIQNHFRGAHLTHVRQLIPRVFALADFVLKNNDRLGYDWMERKHVAEAWEELVQHLKSINNGA
ncbi:MAG: hypothetical protein JWN70_879 [Planctomycetaceae bacterium]|nr:hypothetical protein [Planctomycetaceae bacterium]